MSKAFIIMPLKFFALSLLLAGCAVGPDYGRPEMELPEKFGLAGEHADPADPAELARWWERFNDPVLNSLIDQAIQSNPDLRIAEARIKEARALLGISWLALIPTVDLDGSYTRRKDSENTRIGDTGSAQITEARSLYEAGLDAVWELDIFGGKRRRIEASEYLFEAQVESAGSVLVSLLSEVALNYTALRSFQHELAITEKNAVAQRETYDIQKMRLEVGIATELTVAQSEAQLNATESAIPGIRTEVQKAAHRLGVLLDLPPDALTEELFRQSAVPAGPAAVPPGLPSELIRRRPDVRRAERELAAATANIGVAIADLFPKFSLTGEFGYSSEALDTLSASGSKFWSAGPSVTLPLFGLLPRWSNVKAVRARQEQVYLAYRRTVLASLEEVENALVAHRNEQLRRDLLRRAVDANSRSLALAKQLYEAGAADFLNVLNAQQSLFESEDSLVKSEQLVSANLIALYKALGGGWQESAGKT